MLQDPENPFEEWEEQVWAPNLEVARSRCAFIAEQYDLVEVFNVSQKTKAPTKTGQYLFICWFRAEVTEVEDDGRDTENPDNSEQT